MGSAKKDFNPFSESTAGKYFVGRDDQLKQYRVLLKSLREKVPSNFYVVGVHGTGKSSYLEKLAHIAQGEGFLGVSANLDADSSARDHATTILRALVETLQFYLAPTNSPHKPPKLLADWDSGLDSTIFRHPKTEKLLADELRRDLRTVESMMEESGIPGAVICIDEGQRIDPLALSALKNAGQGLGSFLYVISLRLVVEKGSYSIADGRALLDQKAKEAEGDFGASRFFLTGFSMGPFDTDAEAAACVQKRLEDNVVDFEQPVIDQIVRASGRVPREIISLASNIYLLTRKKELVTANIAVFDEAFKEMYKTICLDAASLCSIVSDSTRAALRGLLEMAGSATASQIAGRMFGGVPSEIVSHIVTGIQGDLDRVCTNFRICRKIEDRYTVADTISSYALELALNRG